MLILIGAGFALATGSPSITPWIPALVGILLLVAGLLAHREPLRKHAIHAALAIALLAALGSLMNVVKIGQLFTGTDRPAPIIESLLLFIVCVAYVAVGVRSFIAARRTRQAN